MLLKQPKNLSKSDGHLQKTTNATRLERIIKFVITSPLKLFDYLSAGQRELMISGTCDTCWNKFFPYANKEEEEE